MGIYLGCFKNSWRCCKPCLTLHRITLNKTITNGIGQSFAYTPNTRLTSRYPTQIGPISNDYPLCQAVTLNFILAAVDHRSRIKVARLTGHEGFIFWKTWSVMYGSFLLLFGLDILNFRWGEHYRKRPLASLFWDYWQCVVCVISDETEWHHGNAILSASYEVT